MDMNLSSPMVWPNTVVTGIHDGDTISVDIDLKRYVNGTAKPVTLGFHISIVKNHLHFNDAVRLYGLNAAELSTDAGKAAQKALVAFMPVGSPIVLTTWLNHNDKYGRILAGVKFNDTDVNQWLIDNGYAIAWDGSGPKPVPA